MDRAVDDEEAGDEHHEYRVVHRPDAGEVDEAEEPAARYRLDAVLAAGKGRLQVEEEDHLRERQRDHREVDAEAPDRKQARDDGQQEGARGAEDDGQLRGETPDLGGMRRGVPRGAEEHRVAEREQAAEAEQQVEGAGEEREAHRLHHEHRVDDERRDREEQRHDGDTDVLMFHLCAPNSPAGLISSTIAMMMKITVLDASG
jgi:hypothetical protein